MPATRRPPTVSASWPRESTAAAERHDKPTSAIPLSGGCPCRGRQAGCATPRPATTAEGCTARCTAGLSLPPCMDLQPPLGSPAAASCSRIGIGPAQSEHLPGCGPCGSCSSTSLPLSQGGGAKRFERKGGLRQCPPLHMSVGCVLLPPPVGRMIDYLCLIVIAVGQNGMTHWFWRGGSHRHLGAGHCPHWPVACLLRPDCKPRTMRRASTSDVPIITGLVHHRTLVGLHLHERGWGRAPRHAAQPYHTVPAQQRRSRRTPPVGVDVPLCVFGRKVPHRHVPTPRHGRERGIVAGGGAQHAAAAQPPSVVHGAAVVWTSRGGQLHVRRVELRLPACAVWVVECPRPQHMARGSSASNPRGRMQEPQLWQLCWQLQPAIPVGAAASSLA